MEMYELHDKEFKNNCFKEAQQISRKYRKQFKEIRKIINDQNYTFNRDIEIIYVSLCS
jgi:hypothetical protein